MAKIRVFTDKLQHMTQEFSEMGMSISDLEPVDINGGLVAVDKQDPTNLLRTQKNIYWKTTLVPQGDIRLTQPQTAKQMEEVKDGQYGF